MVIITVSYLEVVTAPLLQMPKSEALRDQLTA